MYAKTYISNVYLIFAAVFLLLAAEKFLPATLLNRAESLVAMIGHLFR
jgi:hypothetical protein